MNLETNRNMEPTTENIDYSLLLDQALKKELKELLGFRLEISTYSRVFEMAIDELRETEDKLLRQEKAKPLRAILAYHRDLVHFALSKTLDGTKRMAAYHSRIQSIDNAILILAHI